MTKYVDTNGLSQALQAFYDNGISPLEGEIADISEGTQPDFIFDTVSEMNTAIQGGDVPSGSTIYVKEGSGGSGGALYKVVSCEANQGLTTTEQANARANIGAGTSNFDGAYSSLTGKPTLGDAAAKGVEDSSSASAISTGTNLVTERDIYYGLPKINNAHTYTSNSNFFTPTSGGTSGQYLKSAGSSSTPTWQSADTTPTSASTNLITSGAVYTAVSDKAKVGFTTTDPGENANMSYDLLIVYS